MQFTRSLRDGVRRGEITSSIRIWISPRVKRGGRYRMGEGHIEVDSIEQIEFAAITPRLARESGFKSVVELLKTAKHGAGNNVYLVRFHYVAARGATKAAPASARRRVKSSGVRQRQRIARLVGQLPEGKAVGVGDHLSLEVRKKRFGWFLADHHGDGRIALNCKASADMHDVLRQLAPQEFHLPRYLGNKGWIGLWLDIPDIDWSVVELALREAYLQVAPKALAKGVQAYR